MPPRFVLNEFDLDLPAASLLVGLGLVVVVIVVAGAIDGVMVVNETVLADGASGRSMGVLLGNA